jgi:hypothetical protein
MAISGILLNQFELRGNNIDVFGLDAAEDFLAFVEIQFLLTIVCQKSLQLQAAGHRDGQVINGSLEHFGRNAAGKGVRSARSRPAKANLFRAEGEEKFPASSNGVGFHIEFQTAFDVAMKKSIAPG